MQKTLLFQYVQKFFHLVCTEWFVVQLACPEVLITKMYAMLWNFSQCVENHLPIKDHLKLKMNK